MNDIMVDLETMDNVGSATIVSIGAVQCDLTTGETGEEFYRVVDLHGQIKLGRTVSADTIYWWLQQSDGAREALSIPGKVLLTDMCTSFNAFINNLGKGGNIRLWGNGASFDNAILRSAYRSVEQELVIPFWQDRDMRTILGFYPGQLKELWRKNNMRMGVYHNPVDDCRHQIKYCSDILKELGVQELY